MDWKTVAAQAFVALQPILAALGAAVLVAAYAFIRTHTKNAYAQGAMTRLGDAIAAAVKESDAIAVADVQAGKTPDKIKADLVENVKTYMGAKGMKVLMHVLGLDDGSAAKYISAKIAAHIHDLGVVKAAAGIAPPGPSTAPSATPAAPATT